MSEEPDTRRPDVVDCHSPTANMYGCEPCPECGSVYRWPNQKGMIVCDDCGFHQPILKIED